MASDVLANQNESSWAHMKKIPYSNPHLNANPNPKPKKKQKQFHDAAANGVAGRYKNSNVDSAAVARTVSDDAYSFNQTSTSRDCFNCGAYLSYNVASYTKSERLELRLRFARELNKVKDLRTRIKNGELGNADPVSRAKLKKFSGNKRPVAAVGSVPKKPVNGHVKSGAVANFEILMKECAKVVAKLLKHKHGYVFKAPVDAVALGLTDYHDIVRRPMDLGTVKTSLAKNLYQTPIEFAADVRLTFNNAMLYNPKSDPYHGMAEQMLAQFEAWFRPIQEKMDSSVGQNRERDFRVNEELKFRGIEELQGSSWNTHSNQMIASPLRPKKVNSKASPVPVAQFPKRIDRVQTPTQAHSSASTPSHYPSQPMNQSLLIQEELPSSPVRAHSIPIKEQIVGRGAPAVKLPKPRAKDPDKREMSMEEKQKLGLGLQSLPLEKMPQLIQIVRKRNEHLAQDGDEIELDIEALDTETLWELDRFVTNWKKMFSKSKRQALMGNSNPVPEFATPGTPTAEADMGTISDDKNDDELGKKFKVIDEEDVDIDDDMPATSFPPVEIEKDEGGGGQVDDLNVAHNACNDLNVAHDAVHGHSGVAHDAHGNASSTSSSSGSSGSDSSSSSDSGSGSSSGSDSDADDAQS